jgi:hypothetical protein
MESHPIPQQISSYQFRLVGDMTLKQFFQLAGGVLVSIIFYASKLHPLIKWPFIIFFALLGVGLAFFPFEDRPLETWLISFFRNIYSPTLFRWKKINMPLVFYQNEAATPSEKVLTTPSEQKLEDYLSKPAVSQTGFFSKFEDAEKNFLKRIGQIFSSASRPSGQIVLNTAPIPPTTNQPLTVPLANPPLVKPQIVVEEKPQETVSSGITLESVTPLTGNPLQSQISVQFSLDAAPPNPPTVPNTIVGQIIDAGGKIIEGAILEIRDASGRPVRALRSNKLGHFMVVTPLTNGRYEIFTEKEEFSFESVYFEAQGGIIPPIAIRAKKQISPVTNEIIN